MYASQGDVLKFSRTYSNAFLKFQSTETSRRPKGTGLLVMWKTNANEFIASMVRNVILCGQKLQEAVSSVKIKDTPPKGATRCYLTEINRHSANSSKCFTVDMAVSAGKVTFSVIGDDNGRYFVIGGSPIDDLTYARRICLPGDLVLSSSAWDHCAPNQYEYVIKDSNNVKVRGICLA